jgi:2-aminobenzoate-CoA ligase
MVAPFTWTSHEDRFAIENCPPPDLMPWMDEAWFRAHGITDAPFNAVSALLGSHLGGPLATKPAYIFGNEIWHYADLAEAVGACAALFTHECGLRPGNRVLFHARNSPWFAAGLLATLHAGGVAVLASPSMPPADLAAVARQTAPALCLYGAALARGPAVAPVGIEMRDLADRAMRYRPRDGGPGKPPVATAPTDPAVILFTSGSTGAQKASVNFHRDLIVVGRSYFTDIVPITASDVVVGTPSLSFAYGLETMLLAPLGNGATVVLHQESHALPVLTLAQKHRATQIYSTPAAYRAMLEVIGSFRLPNLRACGSAGENLTEALAERWLAATGVHLTTGMGTTELLAFLLGSPPGRAPVGSTGHVVPGFQARVVDESGAELPPGQLGQLAVRGPTGCKYLRNPAAQRERILDGWTTTGDLFARDADGVFWYHGRADDIIIRAGSNIPGLEIERAILELPLAKECAVVGQFDPERQTNRILAFIVLEVEARENADAVRRAIDAHLRQQLAEQNLPDTLVFIDALPRSANGKIQRFKLRYQRPALVGNETWAR